MSQIVGIVFATAATTIAFVPLLNVNYDLKLFIIIIVTNFLLDN